MFALFDLDDTLHNKTASLKSCSKSMYENFLLNSDIETTGFTDLFVSENCIIQPKAQVFSKLAKSFSINPEIESAMLEYFDARFHTYSQRFEYVIEALDFLQRNDIQIGCVTNGRDFFQRNKIKALGLSKYFDVIVTSGDLEVKKPDPMIFQTALKKLGASAKDCVIIGDNLKADMEPAKKLEMKTIWVSSSNKKPEYVDAILSSISQFEEIWNAIVEF